MGGFATISRTITAGNGVDGIAADFSASVSIMSTTAAQNDNAGFNVSNTLVPGTIMTLESSIAPGNGTGLRVTGNARISNSTFTDNLVGIDNVIGFVQTRRNNTVRGNATTDVSGTLTPIGGQ